MTTEEELPHSRKEAKELGQRYYFTGNSCPKGHISKRQTLSGGCTKCGSERQLAKYHLKKKDGSYIDWYKSHPERQFEIQQKYRKNHSDVRNASTNARRVSKINALPKWLGEFELFQIKEMYHLAKLRSQSLGIAFDVDHIIPLKGGTVCGLHVPENLRIVSANFNRSRPKSWTQIQSLEGECP